MWIRCQDKKDLVNAQESISITRRSTGDMFSDPKDDVVYYEIVYGIDRLFTLGIYESEEEAIKVLDMIQETIFIENKSFHYYQNGNQASSGESTFQMPPAGFSKAGDSE